MAASKKFQLNSDLFFLALQTNIDIGRKYSLSMKGSQF